MAELVSRGYLVGSLDMPFLGWNTEPSSTGCAVPPADWPDHHEVLGDREGPGFSGARQLWLDDLQFTRERVPVTAGAVTVGAQKAVVMSNFETGVSDWLPVRVMTVSFALVGNFVAVTRVMLHELLDWHVSAGHLVAKVGRVADDIPEEEDRQRGLERLDSLWELLLRCAVLWYACFALWTVLV